eukprot:TRINITY_DN3600_c0_g1_i3.p1 TRINITY_DN3600_c0_g1~~TRINITY_DN3600_c0_g1_i3.p1  ORF type:complete len:886 (-),score=288.59 TRINITY_DN3600_c0_g1_i3:54-2711(-)
MVELKERQLAGVTAVRKEAVAIAEASAIQAQDALSSQEELRQQAQAAAQQAVDYTRFSQRAATSAQQLADSAEQHVQEAVTDKLVYAEQQRVLEKKVDAARKAAVGQGVGSTIQAQQAQRERVQTKKLEEAADEDLIKRKAAALTSTEALDKDRSAVVKAKEALRHAEERGAAVIQKAVVAAREAHGAAEEAASASGVLEKHAHHSALLADAAGRERADAAAVLATYTASQSKTLKQKEGKAVAEAKQVKGLAEAAKTKEMVMTVKENEAYSQLQDASLKLQDTQHTNRTDTQMFDDQVNAATDELHIAQEASAAARGVLERFRVSVTSKYALAQKKVDVLADRDSTASGQAREAQAVFTQAKHTADVALSASDQLEHVHVSKQNACDLVREQSEQAVLAWRGAAQELQRAKEEEARAYAEQRQSKLSAVEEEVKQAKEAREASEDAAEEARRQMEAMLADSKLSEAAHKHDVKMKHKSSVGEITDSLKARLAILGGGIRSEQSAAAAAEAEYTKTKEVMRSRIMSERYAVESTWEDSRHLMEKAEKAKNKAEDEKRRAEVKARRAERIAGKRGQRLKVLKARLLKAERAVLAGQGEMQDAAVLRSRVEDDANNQISVAKDAQGAVTAQLQHDESTIDRLEQLAEELGVDSSKREGELNAVESEMNATLIDSARQVRKAKQSAVNDTMNAKAAAKEVENVAAAELSSSKAQLAHELAGVEATTAASIEQTQQQAQVKLSVVESDGEPRIAQAEEEIESARERIAGARRNLEEARVAKEEADALREKFQGETDEHRVGIADLKVKTANIHARRVWEARRSEMRAALCLSQQSCEQLRSGTHTLWGQGTGGFVCAEEEISYQGKQGCFGESHPVLSLIHISEPTRPY